MKPQYVEEQLALQAEQEQDFLRTTSLFAAEFAQALKTMDLEKYQTLAASPVIEVLIPYITENFEITKLYMAANVTDSVRAVHSIGVPSNITENLKKRFFAKIVTARNQQDLASLARQLLTELSDAYQKYSVGSYSYLIQRAVEYIHIRKCQPLSCGAVAKYLHADRTYLSKRFHREVGMTMHDYIHTTKMDLAEEMIHNRSHSLREIADFLGYENYSYFCRLYKKYKGRLPSKG